MPTLDRELVASAAALAASAPPRAPAVGDWSARRANIDALYAALGAQHAGQRSAADRHADGAIETLDFHVSSADGHQVPLRLYKPAATPTALVVYAHGGGFIAGSLQGYDHICRRYAADAGVAILAVGYRLAPETPPLAAVEDCTSAVVWAIDHVAERGLSGGRVVIMGDSAGGGLAAATALLCRDRGVGPLAAQVLIYPMLDDSTDAVVPDVEPFVTWTAADNVTGWGALLGDNYGTETVPAYAVPARAASLRNLPRTYLEVGQLDLFCAESIQFASRLIREGVDVQFSVHPGAFHGFDQIAPASRLARNAFAARVDFLKSF